MCSMTNALKLTKIDIVANGTSSQSSSSSQSNGSNIGAIVGGTIGGVVALIALGVVAWFWWRRRRSAEPDARSTSDPLQLPANTTSRAELDAVHPRHELPIVERPKEAGS